MRGQKPTLGPSNQDARSRRWQRWAKGRVTDGKAAKTSADDGSAGHMPRQSNGARSEQGALARREYDLLASEATECGRANAGASGSEASHGSAVEQEGMEAEEDGDKTLQNTLPARGQNRGEDETRGTPKCSRALNTCVRQKWEGGGGHPTQQRVRGTLPCGQDQA